VLVDHLLDRHRARHRGARAERRRRGAEREAGDMPQGLQQRRPNPALW
jgi:hypothetical protein